MNLCVVLGFLIKWTNFESKVMAEVCTLLTTTPLHLQLDGQEERYNRTMIEMPLGKIKESQGDWDLQLQPCMMAYKSYIHKFTGEIPNTLMLGREIKVALDVITESAPEKNAVDNRIYLAGALEYMGESGDNRIVMMPLV